MDSKVRPSFARQGPVKASATLCVVLPACDKLRLTMLWTRCMIRHKDAVSHLQFWARPYVKPAERQRHSSFSFYCVGIERLIAAAMFSDVVSLNRRERERTTVFIP